MIGVAFAAFDLEGQIEIDMLPIVLRVLVGIAVPLAAGMWLATHRPGWVAAQEHRLERVAIATFAVLVVIATATQAATVLDHLGELLIATIALNVIAMALGFAASRLARLDRPQAVAISIELGIHNAALAVAIGTAVDERLAVPAAVYSAVMVVTGTAFAYAMARSGRQLNATA